MVGGTRSRSILKDADTSSSNSAGVKGKDMSGSSTYAPALSDLPNLRRSSRETPAKKARTLSPSPQKSEKLDNQTPSSSSDKKKSERAEKKSSRSPLRRSGRLEKNGLSSSSGSIKASNSSSPQGKKSKVKVEKNGTLKDAVTSEQGKDNKGDIKSVNVSQKRKRLDFHSYRSFLRPQANIRKTPEVGKKLEEVRRALQDDVVDSGASDPKEIQDGGDDCRWRDWREVHENRNCEDLVEGSSCGSRELSPLGDDAHSKKHKVCSPEANESKDESDSSNSKCTDRSSQSSPVAVTGRDNLGTATEGGIDGEADSIVADKLGRKELRAAELVESTSEETSPAVYGASRIGNTSIIVSPAIKDGCEPVGKLEAPCTSVAVARCSHEDEEELKPESIEKLAGTKSEDCSNGPSHTIAPIEEDRGKLTVTEITGSAEEHLSSEESLCEIEGDMGTNACGICKKPGMLLCCDGKDCKRSYHLACLDPHLKDIPVGVWLCPYCVKKKMESGVYSVSQGIESVFDSKEGMQSENHYLVKYKGLSHVHNRWIPESQILIEAPTLLAKFNRRRHKEKVVWKQEWTEPHRLLQKRLMMPRKLADKYFSGLPDNDSICHHEWLVKWKGLGYDHTSWESEYAPVLRSPEAMSLIRNYESRLEEAKSRPSRVDKAQQAKKSPFHKLLTLPDGFPPGFDNDHLNSINRLREFWHRSQNAVFIDEQERIIKLILFILALQSHACQPFLIMSTPSSLSVWESEFSRLAPNVNLVIYSGNRDARKVIRNVEFSEGGCIMFQVLLSQPDSIVEDFEDIKCIDWEMIVVDECQNLRISKHFEKLKHLSSDFKLILLSGQLKDSVAEHLNLLSFLYSGEKENCVNILKFDSKDTVAALATLKEKIAHYLAYERKPDSLKFDEYWVPVRLSNVQLEQYCSTLLSNSISLRSSSKIDPVGALRDIVISTRKCCDHPYIVNPLLQSELTKNSPPADYLDIGVNASGKLLLLDKILQEIKNQGLRVLILFQSIGGAGRNSIGDILDDFLRQRFGADSYERVDCGLLTSKKLAALNMFNDKAKERFIFLIENRACLPSIKLSSVDAAIIFDSDWNPLNDLRALQKISIESQFEQVIVFRLYSSCTVEEKVLIFAKQDMILESNIRNINRSVSHSLLSWGASYLFSKLDEFHQHDKPSNCSEASTNKAFLNDVMSEVLTHLPNKAEGCDTGNCSILIKAQHSGASYSRNIVLVGEKEGLSSLDKDPSSFWSDILDGRYPKWRYIPPSSQRNRRKVQSSDELAKVPEVKNDEGKIKRRKLAGITLNQNYPISLQTLVAEKNKQTAICKDSMVPDNLPPSCGSGQSSPASLKKMFINASCLSKEIEASPNQDNFGSESMPHSPHIVNHFIHNQLGPPMSDCTPGLLKPHMVEYDWTEKLRNTQMNLHLLLKPDLSKMCDTLKLPDDVKNLADALLEYLMNNHHVSREPETILQAFILSLCWRAASWLKHTVDRKLSIALAKKYLNYECEEDQVYSVYSKLRMLKNKFSHWRSAIKDDSEVTSAENKSWASSIEDAPKEPLSCPIPISSESFQLVSEGDKTRHRDDALRCIHNPSEGEHANVIETPAKILENSGSLQEVLLNKRIELIEKVCLRRQEELNLKQQVELSNFNVLREEEKMKLRKAYDTELEVTQSINPDSTVSIYKIRLLNQEFRRKMAAFDQHMSSQRRKLGLMQSDARNKEQQIKACWLEEAKAGKLEEFFDDFPLSDTGFIVERFIVNEKACGDMENAKLACGPSNHPCQDDNASGQVESIESILGLSEIPLVIPDVMVNMSLGSVSSHSECSNTSAMDSFETIEISTEIPTTISGVACKMPVETQYPATHVPEAAGDMPNEEAEDNAVEAETAGDMPNGEAEEIVVETEVPVSQCQNINEVVPTELTKTSGEDPESVLPGIGGDLPLEIVSSPFKSAPTGCLGENSMPTNQERTAASEEGPSYQAVLPQTGLSTQQTIVGSPVQVGQSDQVLLHCDVNPLPFSATTSGGTFSEDAQCHTDGNEVLLQQPVLDTTLLVEHENQVASQDFHPTSTPGTACSVDLSSTYYQTTQQEVPMEPPIISPAPQVYQSDQFISPAVVPAHETHSSTCQAEFLVQQSIAEAGLQIDQSNRLILQSSVHPLPPSIMTPPERTQSEDISHTVQPDSESRFLQNMATANWMPPQGLHHDPLQNELIKIRRQTDLCVKMQEDKKQRLKFECDLEIEMVRGKYDALLQEAETEFLRDKEILDTIYNKVSMNRVLAEQFRARFIENTGGSLSSSQGPRSSYMQQLIHASQPQLAQRTASTSILPSTSFPMPVTLPPVVSSAMAALTPSRLWTPVSTAASPIASSSQVPGAHNSSIPFSTRTPLRPVLLPRANLQSRSEPRAPAPHLHRFRPPVSMSAQNLLLQVGGLTPASGPSPVAPVSPSLLPLSRAPSPVAPVLPSPMPPLSRGPSFPPVHLGNDMPNLTTEVVQSFDEWFSSNIDLPGIEVPASSSDATKPIAVSDVVCISDDE